MIRELVLTEMSCRGKMQTRREILSKASVADGVKWDTDQKIDSNQFCVADAVGKDMWQEYAKKVYHGNA